jgi:hypothetical protein
LPISFAKGEEHMTREDIDELMRDNGISVVGEAVYALCQIVATHEREACAKVCLEEAPSLDGQLCATAIRARGTV